MPVAAAVCCLPQAAPGQALGTVRTQSARVQGTVVVSAGTVTIQSNATVSAGRETAEVNLTRGGVVRVCLGSTLGLSQASAAAQGSARPLLFALQHGAAEIAASLMKNDAVVTPDLRIESSDNAAVDLRLRLNDAGDTCVENAGANAPILHVTEQLSGNGYLVKAGQHIVFERGSVRAVVNRATTQCGCPRPGKGNDFPEAVSAGLLPSTVPAAPAGEAHVQVSTGMEYNGATGTVSAPGQPPEGTVLAEPSGTGPPPPARPGNGSAPADGAGKVTSHNPFRAIGRFFRRLFGGR